MGRLTFGGWRRRSAVLTACLSVGCGGTGSNGEHGRLDASDELLPGLEASVARDSSGDSSPPNAGLDATSDGATSGSDAITMACTAFATAYCSKFQSCEETEFEGAFDSIATCEQRTEQFCPDDFSAPGTGATPSAVESCAQATSALTCAQFVGPSTPAACVWQGSEATGAPCEYSFQCQSEFCGIASGFCGTCQGPPSSALGHACTQLADECATGLACELTGCLGDGGACTGICITPMGAGSACQTPTNCTYPLICLNGVCASPLELGAPCPGVAGCDPAKGLYCVVGSDGGGQTCEQTTFSAAGGPCNESGSATCAGAAECRFTGASDTGTCVAPAPDGQPCTGGACTPPALCIAGICQAPPPASSCK
jgi:hypothetical protein